MGNAHKTNQNTRENKQFDKIIFSVKENKIYLITKKK